MVLFQTVEDKNNFDYIRSNAPFICCANKAWLGRGYYFWDTLVGNAHWWGKVKYLVEGKDYVIVKFNCDPYYDPKLFDLQGNTEHIKWFYEIVEYLKRENLLTDETTVAKVIEYLKDTIDFGSDYDAIRAYGHKSKKIIRTIPFEIGKKYFFEQTPAIQVCLFRKESLNLSKGEIFYTSKEHE